jgi:ABC-type Na+ efflux pump permease subunit
VAFFGPLFGSELHRLARRHLFWLRVQFVALLLLVLYIVYVSWFPGFRLSRPFTPSDTVSLSTSARFAVSFVYSVTAVQFFAVVLLTPIFVGSGVAEEIDRRTIEYLLVTELTNREIVHGKLFSRLVFVLGLLLTGVPVVALSIFFGGVSASLLIQSYAMLFSLTFLLGGFTMFVGRRGDLRLTLLLVYGSTLVGFALAALGSIAITAGFARGGNPFAQLLDAPPLCPPLHFHQLFHSDPKPLEWFTMEMTACHLVVGFLFLSGSTRGLRARLLPDRVRAKPPEEWSPPDPRNLPIGTVTGGWQGGDFETADPRPTWPADRNETPPPGRRGEKVREPLNEDDPLGWKERNHRFRIPLVGSRGWIARLFVLLFWGVMATVFLSMIVYVLEWPGQNREPINWCVRVFGFTLLMVWVVAIGASAAVCVTREREHGTLDPLLTLPVGRDEILAAKWRASIFGSNWLGYSLVALVALGLCGGAVWLGHLVNAVAFVLGLLTLAASLGVWFGVTSRTSIRATGALFGTGLIVTFAPYVLAESVPSWVRSVLFHSVTLEDARVVVESLGPWEVWRTLNPIPRGDFPTGTWKPAVYSLRVVGACISTGFAFGLGCLFWFLARRRFEREGKL